MKMPLLLLPLALSLAGCTQQELPGLSVPFPITVPAAAGAGSPRLASSASGALTLSWMEPSEGGASLVFSNLQMNAWQAPKIVVTDSSLFVNWADLPAVTPISDDTYLAHWLRYSSGAPYSYNVITAFSVDDGQSWGNPFSPHDDGTLSEHGFVSIYPATAGAGLLWLDGRETAGGGHGNHSDGGMTLRNAQLSTNGEVSNGVLVDELVCDCCQTDVAMARSGPVVVYRDRTNEEIRDVYVSRYVDDQWQPGVAIANDNWKISACPVNGPSVSASGKFVVAAWFTAASDMPKVQAAYSNNGGKSFSEPILVASTSAAGQVGTATITATSFAVSWLENDDDSYAINVRTLTSDGQISDVVKVGRTELGRQVPQLARVDDNLLVAWTDEYNDASKIVSVQVPIVNFYDL